MRATCCHGPTENERKHQVPGLWDKPVQDKRACSCFAIGLSDALAFALRFEGRKGVHNADEIMSDIVARRLVEHLERSGFVLMRKPPIVGGAAIGRGFEG
jgi:hypothetical protein